MPIPFDDERFPLTFNDIERSPHAPFTAAADDWWKRDQQRILLNRLDRYADVLTKLARMTDLVGRTTRDDVDKESGHAWQQLREYPKQ